MEPIRPKHDPDDLVRADQRWREKRMRSPNRNEDPSYHDPRYGEPGYEDFYKTMQAAPRHYGLRADPIVIHTEPLTLKLALRLGTVAVAKWLVFRFRVLFGFRSR